MTKLETASHVAVLAVCAVAAYLLLEQRITRQPVPPEAVTAVVGSKLSLDGVDLSKARLNLVIAMSTSCKYCVASTPFWRKLFKASSRDQSGVALIAVSPDDSSEVKEFFDREGMNPVQIVRASLKQLGVAGTPTIVLADGKGVIKKVYRGKLPSKDELSLQAIVDNGGGFDKTRADRFTSLPVSSQRDSNIRTSTKTRFI